jgi:hypothetical protein
MFELRYESLFQCGRGFSFPCDANGTVDLDTLTELLRRNYFFARAMVGHEFTTPSVIPCDSDTR